MKIYILTLVSILLIATSYINAGPFDDLKKGLNEVQSLASELEGELTFPDYSPLGKRIANGEAVYENAFFWITDDGTIGSTDRGWSRVPKNNRNLVYLKKEEAEQALADASISPEEKESQKRKGEQKSSEGKIVQDFYDLFSDRGTKVITETIKFKNVFDEDMEQVKHYIEINNMRFDVSIGVGNCPSYEYYKPSFLEENFPFNISRTFDDYLNYETSGVYLGYLFTQYKLSDGTKGSHWIGVTTKKKEMKDLYISGYKGTDTFGYSPLSLNMVSYRKLLQSDQESSGDLTIVIMGKTDSENITFTLNPFHSSWLRMYKSHCKISNPELDTSGADDIDMF